MMLKKMITASRRLVTMTFALALGLSGLPGLSVATAAESRSTLLISAVPHPEPQFFRAEARLLVHNMPGIGGKPIRATTLLFVPRGTPPAGGWPIVAWSHGTTTPGQKTCAPSLSPDLDGGLTRDGFKSDYAFQIGELVNAGYAVVAPDLEGLGPEATVAHPYFSETSFARSLIASVRAAREAEPTLSNRYAAVGHSEGGHGALSVDRHAGEAPELTLVGIVASAPYTSIAAIAAFSAARGSAESDPEKAQSFRVTEQFQVMLMSAGLLAQSPDFNLGTVMGDGLKRVMPQFLASCSVPSIAVIQEAMKAGGTHFAGLKPGWETTPQMRAFLAENDPAVTPGFTLHHPTLIVQGSADPLVPEPLNTRFISQLSARGAPVTYKVYAGEDHFSIIRRADGDVLAFLAARFRS
jgi:pimeloyl-ACP methyl ester carboxylesterase